MLPPWVGSGGGQVITGSIAVEGASQNNGDGVAGKAREQRASDREVVERAGAGQGAKHRASPVVRLVDCPHSLSLLPLLLQVQVESQIDSNKLAQSKCNNSPLLFFFYMEYPFPGSVRNRLNCGVSLRLSKSKGKLSRAVVDTLAPPLTTCLYLECFYGFYVTDGFFLEVGRPTWF